MCRLLLLHDPEGLDPNPSLAGFRQLSRDSREYHGHGWGCAWLAGDGSWRFHHDIRPVWEDPRTGFPETTLFLGHARSAFRNEGIAVENNMPFTDGRVVFIFNGELHGVRIRSEGRIGAEKIFNYIRRFDQDDLDAAVRKAVGIIDRRSRYIRAMNFIAATRSAAHVCSWFNEDPGYFQMQMGRRDGMLALCSERIPGDDASLWMPLDNHSITTFPLGRAAA